MAYDDHHLESRQGGIILVSHGNRIASNGDLGLEATPRQWAPMHSHGSYLSPIIVPARCPMRLDNN